MPLDHLISHSLQWHIPHRWAESSGWFKPICIGESKKSPSGPNSVVVSHHSDISQALIHTLHTYCEPSQYWPISINRLKFSTGQSCKSTGPTVVRYWLDRTLSRRWNWCEIKVSVYPLCVMLFTCPSISGMKTTRKPTASAYVSCVRAIWCVGQNSDHYFAF